MRIANQILAAFFLSAFCAMSTNDLALGEEGNQPKEALAASPTQNKQDEDYKQALRFLSKDPAKDNLYVRRGLKTLRGDFSEIALKDDKVIDRLLEIAKFENPKADPKLGDVIKTTKAWLDNMVSRESDKLTPGNLNKINVALGKPAAMADAPQHSPKSAVPADMPSAQGSTLILSSTSTSEATTPVQVSTGAVAGPEPDTYPAYVNDLKDPKKAAYAVKTLKSKFGKQLIADDQAIGFILDIWLKKKDFDGNARSEARIYLDSARSYYKIQMSTGSLQKIDDAFKAVRY